MTALLDCFRGGVYVGMSYSGPAVAWMSLRQIFANPRNASLSLSKTFLTVVAVGLLAIAGRSSGQTSSQTQRPANPSSNDLEQRIQQARAAEQSGDPEAIAAADKNLIAAGLRSMGGLRIMQASYPEAIDSFKRSLDFEDNSDAHLELALAYMYAGRADDALAEAGRLIAADPKNGDAWSVQGKLQMDKKEYAKAVDSLSHALDLQSDVHIAYALGFALLNLHQNDRADAMFHQIIQASGDHASAHIMVGRAYQNAGRLEDAAREFKRSIELDPKERGHYFLGLLYFMQNEWRPNPQIRQEFVEEVAVNPKDFFGNFFLGYIGSTENNFDESDKYLRVAADARPDWPEPWLYLGINAYTRRDNAGAEQFLRKAVSLTGKDVERNNYQIRRAYYILGRILIQQGKKEEGEADVKLFREMEEKNMELSRQRSPMGQTMAAQRGGGMAGTPTVPDSAIIDPAAQAITTKPQAPELSAEEKAQLAKQEQQIRSLLGEAFNDLGTSQARRKEYELALVNFKEAEKWNPETPRLSRNLGLAAFRTNHYAEAARALKTVVAADPGDKLAQSMLAMSLFSTDQFAEAAKAFEPLADAAYSDPRIAYAWAYSLARINDPVKASAVLEKLSAQSLTPDLLMLVGQVYNSIGDSVHALASFEKAAAGDPALQRAHYFAGLALIRLDRPNEAIPQFEAELKLNANDPDAQYNLAYALLQTSRRDQAMAILRPLVSAHPTHAQAQYQLGKTLLDMDETKEAIPHLEAAAQANPDLDYVHYQLQMAYRKAGRGSDADREAKLYREIKDRKRAASPTAH